MFDLDKGSTFDLGKNNSQLSYVRVGLSWDENSINGRSADCDVSVFLVSDSGRLPDAPHLIFFNNLCGRGCGKSTQGICNHETGLHGVKHWGDNRDGSGDGDDELVDIDLSQIESNIEQIVITVTIANPDDGFHFGNVTNPSARVYDAHTNEILCEYQMNEAANGNDGLLMARLYRDGSSWVVEALGSPFTGGLQAAINMYHP